MTGTKANPDRLGRGAERLAVLLLRLKGFRILERRLATRWGEIDIVARRGDLLVFVEVKRRRTVGEALEALSERQRRRIVRAAEAYRRSRPEFARLACRFDLVAIGRALFPAHLADAWRIRE
jgi:putative endonuclease